MKIFKFGGASVRDAEAVRNVLKVLQYAGTENRLVVISAMGKTTNALEVVVETYLKNGRYDLSTVKDYHFGIMQELFGGKAEMAFSKVKSLFETLENFLEHNKSTQYDFVYDQIVSYGELISTTIVSEFLNSENLKNSWIDARLLIKTDSTYRDAQVNWEETQRNIKTAVNGEFIITQGFIGADANNFTTTLGREGSDYTAAIFAYCLNAESVTIWKDVQGIYNGDPRVFPNTQMLNEISYEEAIELAFYGASVIHPKTLQPLQRKEIPLFVKSFLNPQLEGSAVCKMNGLNPLVPCFIVKQNQALISLSSLDFSFMVEENISEIFNLFHQYQIKVNLIQNSAISFSVCVENKFNTLEKLIQHLKAKFKVTYTENVALYTIRHFDAEAEEQLEKDKKILLKQVVSNTLQIVTAA